MPYEKIPDLRARPLHLKSVYFRLPGLEARGMAGFKADPTHFRSRPIVRASQILQALLEISEVAIRSFDPLKKYCFLAFGVENFVIRKKIFIDKKVFLPVSARRFQSPLHATHGRIRAIVSLSEPNEKKKRPVAEAIIKFILEP